MKLDKKLNKKLLVVIDMQNDFIDGALGTKEARRIVPNVVTQIELANSTNYSSIAVTLDTHECDYMSTQEGKNLPVEHCMMNEWGWELNDEIQQALNESNMSIEYFTKNTFGSEQLANYIKYNKYNYVKLVGLCSDICVISNALLIKALNPEVEIAVLKHATAGVNPTSHKNAIEAMRMCQIKIIESEF